MEKEMTNVDDIINKFAEFFKLDENAQGEFSSMLDIKDQIKKSNLLLRKVLNGETANVCLLERELRKTEQVNLLKRVIAKPSEQTNRQHCKLLEVLVSLFILYFGIISESYCTNRVPGCQNCSQPIPCKLPYPHVKQRWRPFVNRRSKITLDRHEPTAFEFEVLHSNIWAIQNLNFQHTNLLCVSCFVFFFKCASSTMLQTVLTAQHCQNSWECI